MLWNCFRLCSNRASATSRNVFTFWQNNSFTYLKSAQDKVLESRSRLHHCTKIRACNTKKPQKPVGIVTYACIGIGIGTACGIKLIGGTMSVLCKAPQKTRVSELIYEANETPETSFDWKKFLSMLWPHLWHLLGATLAAITVAVLNIQIPQLLGHVVNVVVKFIKEEGTGSFISLVKEPAAWLIYMYTAQAVFTFTYIYLLSCVGERVATQMRQELFNSILKQDIAFFDKHRTGEIVNRLTTDVQDFKSAFKLCISQGLRSTTQIFGCGVSLYLISPQMTWAVIFILPSVILTGTLIGSLLRKLSRDAQAQFAKATIVGEEAISNIRTVRVFAMEQQENKIFCEETEKAQYFSEKLGLGIGIFQAGANLFLNGMILGTLYMGGHLLSTNQITAGDLMSFLVASQTIQRSLAQISLLFGHIVKGVGAGARVFEFINIKPSMPIAGGKKIPFHSLIADVCFKDVSFAYPTRPEQIVLHKFNLRIPAGKMVAIVGSSGNGKSTVASLLERLYDINEGSIAISGVDIRQLDPSWLRGKAIGFINQEPVLFATSIMENIRYGCPSASDAEVIEAAKSANAHEFIQSFPEGYNTVVGERGVTVSGGQKQRIAIARALLKNPAILILDEATSALDAESEKIVQNSLESVSKGRTVLVIAHRLSTVRNADLIVVLHNGVIVEMGTHEELKNKQGLYWNLIRQQEVSEKLSRNDELLIEKWKQTIQSVTKTTKTRNGHITRISDEDLRCLVIELCGSNVATTYIGIPADNTLLGIRLPFLVMIVKNLKKYFTFEVQILDDKDTKRRFRISTYQTQTKVRSYACTMPIVLQPGWNQVQFDLEKFTRKAFGTSFVEVARLQVHANCRLRRIYFADKLYSENELPQEYKLYMPSRTMPIKNFPFQGLVAPVFTPIKNDRYQSIDLEVISSYATFLLNMGIKGILVNGTSGEGPSLTITERKSLAEAWAKAVKETKQVLMVQVGGACLKDVQELAKHAESLGSDGLLCLPELYFKPATEKELVKYLKSVGEAAPNTPLLYYHIPSFSGVKVSMPHFITEAEQQIPTFAGMKFTDTNLVEAAECVKLGRGKLSFFLGCDQLLSAAMALGIDSAIATTLNILPQHSINIIENMKNNNIKAALKQQQKLTQAINAITQYGTWVPTMKAAMNLITPINVGPPREPIQPLNDKQIQQLKKELQAMNIM